MSGKWHINNQGKPGRCQAVYNCRFKASPDEHFETEKQARDHYELKMTNELLRAVSKDSLGLRELTKLARITSDPEIIDTSIGKGSARTFSALAENPNVTSEQLARIAGQVDDEKLLLKLHQHMNFPVREMTPEQVAYFVRNPYDYRVNPNGKSINDLLDSNDLNDEQFMAVVTEREKNTRPYAKTFDTWNALRNRDNNVSDSLINELAAQGRLDVSRVITSNRINPSLIKDLDDKHVYWGDVYRNTDQRVIHGFAEWAVNRKASLTSDDWQGNQKAQDIARHVAENSNTSPETLDYLAVNGLAESAVYKNPNTSPETRARLEAANPRIRVIKTVDDAADKVGGREAFLKALTINVSSKHPHGVNRGYSITRRDFDVDVLNRLGFGRDEVFELVNARQYNAGVSYDPHTGVFEGAVDSTD